MVALGKGTSHKNRGISFATRLKMSKSVECQFSFIHTGLRKGWRYRSIIHEAGTGLSFSQGSFWIFRNLLNEVSLVRESILYLVSGSKTMLPRFFALIGSLPIQLDATWEILSNGVCINSLSLCTVEISLVGSLFWVGYYQKVSAFVLLLFVWKWNNKWYIKGYFDMALMPSEFHRDPGWWGCS
jgi:hypothetical protein